MSGRHGVALGLMIGSLMACLGGLVHSGLRYNWVYLLEHFPNVGMYDDEDWLAICCFLGLHLCAISSICFLVALSRHLPMRITLASLSTLNAIVLWAAVVLDGFYGAELTGYAISATLTATGLFVLAPPHANSPNPDP